MGIGKINLSKPTFLILFLVVAGIGLTIGAASALIVFTENLQVDNGAGDSEVEITSDTGDSKLTLTDQGKKEYAIVLKDGKKKLVVQDVSKGKTRLVLKSNGDFKVNRGMSVDGNTLVVDRVNDRVGIGTKSPTQPLHVIGNIRTSNDLIIGEGRFIDDDIFPGGLNDDHIEIFNQIRVRPDGDFFGLLVLQPDSLISSFMNLVQSGGESFLSDTTSKTGFFLKGSGDDVTIGDDLFMVGTSATDDDTIWFDTGLTEFLNWDDSDDRFEFSDNLATLGSIQAGSISQTQQPYSRFGFGSASHGQISTASDVFISSDLEVQGDAFIDGGVRVGTDSATDNDFVCFDDNTCNRNLAWVNSLNHFQVVGDTKIFGKLTVTGAVDPPAVTFSGETYASIRELSKTVDPHEEVMLFWNTNTKRIEVYAIAEDNFYTITGELISETLKQRAQIGPFNAKPGSPVLPEQTSEVTEQAVEAELPEQTPEPPEETPP